MEQDHNFPVYFPLRIATGQLIATINGMQDEERRILRAQNQKSKRWTGQA